MMMLKFALATAVSAFVPEDMMFEQFMSKYNKSYESEEERTYRKSVFVQNLAVILETNAKNLSYKLGVNEFADLTSEEFVKQRMGYRRPAETWGSLKKLGTHKHDGSALPDSWDWTTKGAVTGVKNQQQCGSCWAFSTTGSLEGANFLASGKLTSLSEQQLVDCSSAEGNMGCGGGLMDNAFKYAETHAMCTEASYPYKAVDGTCHADGCTVGIAKGDVTGFHDVDKDDEEGLMSAVHQQPTSIAVEADQMAFQHYHSGVLSGSCGTNLDHGVLAVGYGALNGTKYWKVKNSWGGSWGMNGYLLIERGAGGAGKCGILADPSYPIVKKSSDISI